MHNMPMYHSPTKLNLFLHILDKRSDGYHNLETIFQLIDYGDEIEITTTNNGVIQRMYGNEHIDPDEDLLLKAANILQPFNASGKGADIGIHKRAPIGGGVGGGSSNAATVLLALNELWELGLTNAELQKLAVNLGADVPVFVLGTHAFATGIGEVLHPVTLPQHYFLVLCPDEPISTAGIFSDSLLTKSPKLEKIPDFFQSLSLENDCLKAVTHQSSKVRMCLEFLNTLPNTISEAKLSGTGCCIFTVFQTEKHAQYASELLKRSVYNNYTHFIARSL